MRALAIVLGFALSVGCSTSSPGAGGAPDPSRDGGTCPMGLRALKPGGACQPIVFAGDCPAGAMPKVGFETCQPVGWHGCPEGFADDPSGWGCAERVPTVACTGATRDAVGSAACVPVGDCAAPFPPPSATLFVNAAFTAGQLDARHFTKIGDALSVATAGAVLSVDSGDYAESLVLSRPVTIFGRCAASVRVRGTATSIAGLSVTANVEVRGVTVTTSGEGASIAAGGNLVLIDGILDGNANAGINIDARGSAHLLRSVIRGTRASANPSGFGAQVIFGGSLELTDSVISRSVGGGILAGETGSNVKLTRTVIRDTDPDTNGLFGYGINRPRTRRWTSRGRSSWATAARRCARRRGPRRPSASRSSGGPAPTEMAATASASSSSTARTSRRATSPWWGIRGAGSWSSPWGSPR